MNRETSPSTLAVKFSCKIMVEVIEKAHRVILQYLYPRDISHIHAVASCMIRSNTARKKIRYGWKWKCCWRYYYFLRFTNYNSLFSVLREGFEVSESDFDPGTTERKVEKTPKKMHRSANDSGGKFHNTRVSIRNVLSTSGTIGKGFGFVWGDFLWKISRI